MNKILILGATSAIAEATARRYAAQNAALYLVGRDTARLQAIAQDLRVRGAAQVQLEALDLNAFEQHAAMLDRAEQALGGLDLALIAHGTLPEQQAVQDSVEATLLEFRTNGLSVIALCTLLAPRLLARRGGALAVISSVAGDRGRASNYVYGAAKAAVSAYLSGLRQRLNGSGVLVLTIKPGLVDTPMTRAFKKGALWAQPDHVARGIVRAIERRHTVVYLPAVWRLIMAIVRAIPEPLFARLKF
jgi:short-subunit dehydrogenase